MRLSQTLSLYLGRQFLYGILLALFVMAVLVFLADLVEHLRRAANKDQATFGIVAAMAFLQLPTFVQKLMPFAALFGGIWTFSRLTRTHELVVARASGVSVWQFMTPALVIALLIGVFVVAVFNPLSSVMVNRYEKLEKKYLQGKPHLLEVLATGLWLRQVDAAGHAVIHAQKISAQGTELSSVIIFLYEGRDRFVGRIDAANARLHPGYWALSDVLLTAPDAPAQRLQSYELETSLTLQQIQESFASPETMSFWSLPRFIKTLEEAGFSATRHRLYWHATLTIPVLLCAMVLLSAVFSLRLTRFGNTGWLIVVGVAAAFVLYFMSDLVFAMGLAGSLPVPLAAWAPAGIAVTLGLALLFHLEDG
jgi:lipopolysaccharide export system permease protein